MGWWLYGFFFHNFFQTSFQNYLKLEVKEGTTNSPNTLVVLYIFLGNSIRGQLLNLTTNPATTCLGCRVFLFLMAKQATSTLYISDQGKYCSSSRARERKGKITYNFKLRKDLQICPSTSVVLYIFFGNQQHQGKVT